MSGCNTLPPRTDLISEIMEFRTAYLKAVARATHDLEFRRLITRTGRFRRLQIDALKIFEKEYGYRCPWALRLSLKDNPFDGPRVNTASGTVMTRPFRGESITIYIPRRPVGISPAEQVEALAAYYHDNPWFLSRRRGDDDVGTSQEDHTDAAWDALGSNDGALSRIRERHDRVERALSAIALSAPLRDRLLLTKGEPEELRRLMGREPELSPVLRIAEDDPIEALRLIEAALRQITEAGDDPLLELAAIVGPDEEKFEETLGAHNPVSTRNKIVAEIRKTFDKLQHREQDKLSSRMIALERMFEQRDDEGAPRSAELYRGSSDRLYAMNALRETSAFWYPEDLSGALRGRAIAGGPGVPAWSSVDTHRGPTPRFDLGTCLDDFISFAAAMFNAVALSWENPKFLELLIHPREPKDTVILLSQWLGYHYPWELELKVRPDECEYDPATRKWGAPAKPELMLTLPWMSGTTSRRAHPEAALEECQAAETRSNRGDKEPKGVRERNGESGVAIMGLVLYNTDGPGYPFTCG